MLTSQADSEWLVLVGVYCVSLKSVNILLDFLLNIYWLIVFWCLILIIYQEIMKHDNLE
jgi:hypothetical protein